MYMSLSIITFINTQSWIGRKFPGFLVSKCIVPGLLLPQWEGPKQGIKPGHLVTAVNGQPVYSNHDIDHIVSHTETGMPLTYTILPSIIDKKTITLTIPVLKFLHRDHLFLFVTSFLIGLIPLAIALFVFYCKPNDPACRVWLFYWLSLAIFMIAFLDFSTTKCYPDLLSLFWYCIASSLLIPFLIYFLNIKKMRGYIFSGQLLIFILLFGFVKYAYGSDILTFYKAAIAVTIYRYSVLLISFIIVINSYITAKDPLIIYKLRLIIYGVFISLIFTACIWFLPSLSNTSLDNWLIVESFRHLILSLCCSYTMVRHNPFDIDMIIRESSSYVIILSLVAVSFFGILGTFNLGWNKIFSQSSPFEVVFFTLIMIALFKPLWSRVDTIIDKRFFGEKYRYRTTIQKTSEVLINILNLEKLLHELLTTVLNSIKIGNGIILLKDKEADMFRVTAHIGYLLPEKYNCLSTIDPIVIHLESESAPIQINDIKGFRRFQEDRVAILRTMNKFNIVLLIPIIFENHLIGLMGLSAKETGAWYSNKDIQLLQTLMNHAAVSIENARKVNKIENICKLKEKSEKQLRLLIGNLQSVIYRYLNDENRTIEFLSDGCIDFFGYQPSDFINNKKNLIKMITHPDDYDYCLKQSKKSAKEKQPYQVEYRIITSSGIEKWVWEQCECVFSDAGDVIGFEGLLIDITDKKLSEVALRESEQMMSEFVTTASHELRTPIHSMQLSVTSLLAGYSGEISHEVKENLIFIEKGIDQLMNVINNFLDLSIIEARKVKPVLRLATPLEIVDRSIEKISSLLRNHNHEIRVEMESDKSILINVDKKRMIQVMINLLSNAIKYTPDNGVIVINAEKNEKNVQICVADNGYGIPLWAQEKIFQKFFQADNIMSHKVGGSGLGLSISEGIINLHGGKLYCQSPIKENEFNNFPLEKERKGSIFIVELPLN